MTQAVEVDRTLSGRTCIVGIGQTRYAKRGGIADRSEFQLCLEAICAAAEDAGIGVDSIDGYCSFGYERPEPVLVQAALGIPEMRFSTMVWGAGGGGCAGAVMNAAAAVNAGLCRYAVVYRSLCQGQYERYGQYRARPRGGAFLAPYGLMSPAQLVAMTFRRHMHLYGTTSEHLGQVAVTARANAQRNPAAIMHGRPMTLEDHAGSRLIADPFRLFDCCLETDGACALIVTTEERARDLKGRPVRILAAGHGNDPGFGPGGLGYHNMPDDDYHSGNGKWLAKRLFAEAGLTPDDIDTIQIYDHYSYTALVMLEVYGFCGRGEGGAYVADGNIRRPDGRLPANTSGGLLSEAYIHGLNLAVEGVRQMRGEATSQVADARTCLVTIGVSAVILGA